MLNLVTMDIIYTPYRVTGKQFFISLLLDYSMNISSCIFVWNISELAIVPSIGRLPSIPLAKNNESEM